MLLCLYVKVLKQIQILQNKSYILAIIEFLMKNIFLQIKTTVSINLVKII